LATGSGAGAAGGAGSTGTGDGSAGTVEGWATGISSAGGCVSGWLVAQAAARRAIRTERIRIRGIAYSFEALQRPTALMEALAVAGPGLEEDVELCGDAYPPPRNMPAHGYEPAILCRPFAMGLL
jgi:hypothetical protein